MVSLKLGGFIYALYIDTNFIEYFNSTDDAVKYAQETYKGLNYFVKPIAYFAVEASL
jgi:hypothetical protein